MRASLRAILVFVSLAVPAFAQSGVAPNPVALDACSVVEKPQDFADKDIAISGSIESSEEELVILCKGSPKRVWLDFPNQQVVKDDDTLKNQNLIFHRSKQSDLFLDYLLQKCAERRFMGRLRGHFQYRKDFSDARPNGYGHLGLYQFRLLVTDVERVQGKPCEAAM